MITDGTLQEKRNHMMLLEYYLLALQLTGTYAKKV